MIYNKPDRTRKPFWRMSFDSETPTISEAIQHFRQALAHLEQMNAEEEKDNIYARGVTEHGNYFYNLRDLSKELSDPIIIPNVIQKESAK